MAEGETLTAEQLAERMGITREALLARAREQTTRAAPNRATRRAWARAGKKKGR